MEQVKAAKTAKRMTDARALLVRDNPFFGHLSMGLQLACAPCGTACTDGTRLIFDPDFAEKLTDREMQFVILHEVLHCVLEHCTRGRTLNSALFNISCDIVVNSTIFAMWGIESFSVAGEEPMHLAPNGKEGREYNAEEVYHMLISGCGNSLWEKYMNMPILDRHDLWKGITDSSRIRDVWKGRIIRAGKACSDIAQIPKSVRQLAKELMFQSKVDWKQLLHDFIQHDTYDYSFTPPDRRFSDGDFYLPAYNIDDEKSLASDIWVCVDTSASISDEELLKVMFEIQDAMRQAGLTGSVSFFDSGITDPVPFTTEEEFKMITPYGGGGTSFHSIFDYMKKKMYPDLPKAILVFTDGYALWPEEEDALNVPVLWLIRECGDKDVPWGRVAEI